MRVPQYPQNGSPVSAGLVQRGQRVVAGTDRPGDELRGASGVGGTAVRAAVADPDPDALPALWAVAGAADSPPLLTVPLWAPIWAAEAVIGFPQSMQNREVASFSRPQNEQTVNRHPPRREPTWRANIGVPSNTSQCWGRGGGYQSIVHSYQGVVILSQAKDLP